MDTIYRDLKYAIRVLITNPGFSIISILALGLGIGSVTTQFTVINAAFLKGLPFPEPQDIVHLERHNLEQSSFNAEVSLLELMEWRERQDVLIDIAGYYNGTANLTVEGSSYRLDGCFISGPGMELLGEKALLGRTLLDSDEDPDAPYAVVISYGSWMTYFGGDKEIVGKNAILNGKQSTIVGVMPEGFQFPVTQDLWFPLYKQQKVEELNWGDPMMTLEVFGRLKEGVSIDTAAAQFSTIATALEAEFPESNQGFRSVVVKPFLSEFMNDQTLVMMSVMLLITFFILLIACANVANLLLARSMKRQKELAVRTALGASRPRIIRQLLTESMVIALIGTLVGLLLAKYNINSFTSEQSELTMPFWFDFSFDFRIFFFSTFITAFAGLAFGLIPSLRASKIDVNEILKDDTRTSSSLKIGFMSKFLVIVQVSLAAIILTLVFLFSKSISNALNVEYTFDPDTAMTARIGLFDEVYPDETAKAQFLTSLVQNLENRPEIEQAAISNRYRFLGAAGTRYEIEGNNYVDEEAMPFSSFQRVSYSFFEALSLPIFKGRAFDRQDFQSGKIQYAIINKAFAEREWPEEDPIGKRFMPHLDFLSADPENNEHQFVQVIGVTDSMMESGIFSDAGQDGAAFFLPLRKNDGLNFATIITAGNFPADKRLDIMREEVMRLDDNLPLYAVGTPRQLIEEDTSQFGFFISIFQNFGIIATFLAGVGIYGVMSFSVNQRIAEFGIRSALGATQKSIFSLVYKHTLNQLALGFIIAIIPLLPIILFPNIKDSLTLFFYEVEPDELSNYIFSFGFVFLIAVLAAFPPALKAARIHPAQALRYD